MAAAAVPEVADPTLARTFRGHAGRVTAVALDPAMGHVASGGDDAAVMVWNFKPQLRAFKFLGHTVRACVRGRLLRAGNGAGGRTSREFCC
jgi:hypothetical protein